METIQLIKKEHYSIIQLDRGKSNPINAQMVAELRSAVAELAADEKVKGAILAGKEHFFSAGLDLPELITYSHAEFETFWKEFMYLLRDLLAFPKPLIAAITGHSPAGGCVLAIGCDYRIMAAGNYKIGLNEVPVGIIVPRHLFDIYAFWVGQHRAYQFLLEGRLLEPQQASDAGLIDLVLPADQVLEAAERKLQQYMAFNTNAWSQTKLNLRRKLIETANSLTEDEFKVLLDHWWHPDTQQMLHGFAERLKKK
jgi:enoyl-CoA hydratase/carnithine racemase